MNIKIFLFLFLIHNSCFATQEIPLVTIWPQATQTVYKKHSLLDSQDKKQVQVISKEQINRSGSLTMSDIVNAKNGLQIREAYAGRTNISMRGFGDNGSSNTLVMLNGQPFLNSDMGPLITNNLPLSEIAQIEISPRSNSVLYGDQAVGGVVNIITSAHEARLDPLVKPEDDKGLINLAYGSFATKQAGLDIRNFYNNSFAYHLGASTYSSNHYREHNTERINNFNLDLNYKGTYLSYKKINQRLELPGKLTWQQTIQNPRQAENDIAFNNQDHDMIETGLKHHLSKNWFANLDLSLRSMDGIGAYDFNQQAITFDESRKAATANYKISGIINFKKHSILPIAGLDFNYGNYKFNTTQNIQKQGGIYSQFEIPITTKLSTILGARHAQAFYNLSSNDQNKPINRAFVTELEANWQTSDNLNLFIRRAENYRFPKTDEMFTIDGSPLKTQTGVSYEAGANFKHKNFSSTLTGYNLDLKNEILAVPIATSDYFVYNKNLDPTRRTGVILDFNLDITEYLQVNTNYNFVNAKFKKGDFAGKDMPFVAKNNLRLAAILKPQKNLQFLTEAIYTGTRYLINDVENRAQPLGGFTIYNLAISYEKKPFVMTLRGNNLTNKLYYGYAVANYQGSQTSSCFYPSAGINVLATLTVKL